MEDMQDMKGHDSHHQEEEKEDTTQRHNMMVIGEKTIFISHLPMFMKPHNFQVIMEATFTNAGKDVGSLYTQDRQSHPQVKMYTLSPDKFFKLPSLFTPPDKPALASFKATIFRGHFERGGKAIKGLTNIDVNIKRIILARELAPGLTKSKELSYTLFGKGQELFLAHEISAPPDFDQILSVKVDNPPSDEEMLRGVSVVILNRENSAAKRIKEKEKVVGQGHVTGAHQFLQLPIEAKVEFYFEEGELSANGSFDPTPEEIKAGFGD